jgi:hypothetical protein
MTEPPKGVVLNRHPVSVEIDGRTVSGTYSTWAGMVTVTTSSGATKTAVSGRLPPDFLARRMLHELVVDEKA